MLGWIQLCSRYISCYLCSSAYSAGDEQYYLGLGGWASGPSKVMSCLMRFEGRKMGSSNTSENSFNKEKIYRPLAPGAKGVRGPSYSPSSMSLAPIARRFPDSCNSVNHVALCDLWMVFIKDLKEHSSTWISHNNEVPSTTLSPNIIDVVYQSMVGFVSAKYGIPKITGEGNQSNTTHVYACLPGTIAPSEATILKCTSICLLRCNTHPSTILTTSLQA